MNNLFYIPDDQYLNVPEWGNPLKWVHDDGTWEEVSQEQYENPINEGFYTCFYNSKRIGVKPGYYDTWLNLGCPPPFEEQITKKSYWWLLLLIIPIYYFYKRGKMRL